MRRLLVFFVLCLTALSTAQTPTTEVHKSDPRTVVKVTLRTPGQPMLEIAKQLSEQTKIKLVIDPTISNEVFVISVKDIPLRDLMDKLAFLTLGEWVQAGEGYRLNTSMSKLRVETEALNAKRKAMIAEAISKQTNAWNTRGKVNYIQLAAKGMDLLNQINDFLGDQSAYSKYQSLSEEMTLVSESSPEAHLVASLANSIPIVDYLAIEPGERKVYSTSPNKIQYQMPASASAAINAFVADYNSWAKGIQEAKSNVGVDRTNGRVINSRWPNFAAVPLTDGVGKVLLSVSRTNYLSGITVRATVYNTKGVNIATSNMSMPVSGLTRGNVEKVSVTGEIKLSKEATEFANAIYGSRSSGRNNGAKNFFYRNGKPVTIDYELPSGNLQNLSAQTLTWLSTPKSTEPLSIYVGPMFLAAADAAGKQLVANIPDRFFEQLSLLVPTGPTIEKLLGLIRSSSVDLADEYGVLTLRPTWIMPDRARVDRQALQSLLQSAQKEGVFGIYDLAAYMKTSPLLFPTGRTIDESYVSTWKGRVMNASDAANALLQERIIWKMAGTFGSSELKRVNPRESMALPSVSSPLGQICQTYLFSSFSFPRISTAAANVISDQDGANIADRTREVTDVFSSGIGPNLKLIIVADSVDSCVAFSAENGGAILLNAESLVMLRKQQYKLKSKYLAMKTITYSLVILNADGDFAGFQISSVARSGSGEVEYNALPQDFRNRVDAFEKMMSGGGV